jgi:hypothetical protein
VKVVLGKLLRVPITRVVAPRPTAESTGKFCRLLGPVSASPGSLGVTPSGARSMPRPPLSWMELPRMALPVPDAMKTPAPTLKAMVLPAPEDVPPMMLSDTESSRNTPCERLGRGLLPEASVPIRLPWIKLFRMGVLLL